MKELHQFSRPLTFFERALRPSLFDIAMIIMAISFTTMMVVGGIKTDSPSFLLSGLISAVILYGLIKTALLESSQNRLSLPHKTIIFGYKRDLPVMKPTIVSSEISIRTGGLKNVEHPCFVPIHVWDKQRVQLEHSSSAGKIEVAIDVSLSLPGNPTAHQVENLLELGAEGFKRVLQTELGTSIKKLGGPSQVFECGFEQLREELIAAVTNSPELISSGSTVEIDGGSLTRTVSSSTGASRRNSATGLLQRTLMAP